MSAKSQIIYTTKVPYCFQTRTPVQFHGSTIGTMRVARDKIVGVDTSDLSPATRRERVDFLVCDVRDASPGQCAEWADFLARECPSLLASAAR